jgi:hypothetical protein
MAAVHRDQRRLLQATGPAMTERADEMRRRDRMRSSREREPAVLEFASHLPRRPRARKTAAGVRARPFSLLASLSLAAAAVAAVVRAVAPFDHGIWLVAYLLLVGFLAQVLLAAGQDSLYRRAGRLPGGRLVRMEAVLWNAGVVFVPLGVSDECSNHGGDRQLCPATGTRSLRSVPQSLDKPPWRDLDRAGLLGAATRNSGERSNRHCPGVGHPLDLKTA